MSRLNRAALLAALFALPATQTHAHLTLENNHGQIGKAYKALVRVGHGCDGTATTMLKINIPEGLIGVKPMPKAGWKLETVKTDYTSAYMLSGEKLTSGVTQIIWSGGSLPDDFYDEFVFTGTIAKEITTNAPLYVPIVQQCEKGAHNWDQIPAAGQDASALKEPAPFISLTAADIAATEIKLGSLVISQPWARATPAGAQVAGGYIRVENLGTLADRLISASSDISDAITFHEMKTEDGVMKMRQLDNGLAIAPGARVEFKPGGQHIMFTGLKRPLKAGETVKVQLMFEKAGAVTLDFRVEPIGAQGPGSGGDEHAGH